MRYIPITNHRVKKNAKRPTPMASSIVEMPAAAKVESITIIMMPAISSTIKMPKTISVKRLPLSFKSSKALMIMVVELIASIPPKKILSIWLQPKAVPHKYPMPSIPPISTAVAMKAVLPTLLSL